MFPVSSRRVCPQQYASREVLNYVPSVSPGAKLTSADADMGKNQRCTNLHREFVCCAFERIVEILLNLEWFHGFSFFAKAPDVGLIRTANHANKLSITTPTRPAQKI